MMSLIPENMNITLLNLTFRERIPEISSYFLIAMAFVMPISVSVGTVLAALIFALWCVEGEFDRKLQQIKSNKVVLAFIAYFLLNVIGLLWTKDIKWGLHIVGKHWKLLLLPVFATMMKKEDIEKYIEAFIYGMVIGHILSLLYIAGLIDFTISSRVTYDVLLAFSCYLCLNRLLFCNIARIKFYIFLLLFISMSINVFLSDGRMGYVSYLLLMGVICFQYFKLNDVRIILSVIFISFLITMISYTYSNSFRTRVLGTINGLINFKITSPSDDVIRLTYFVNSIQIFKSHPLLGVGTGDFPAEYKKINEVNSPRINPTVQPHNNYLLVLTQFGLIGFLVFMSIFFFQIKCFLASKSDHPFVYESLLPTDLVHIRLALPVLFMIIMFTDSYLLGHFTSLVFVFFSSFLYKECEV